MNKEKFIIVAERLCAKSVQPDIKKCSFWRILSQRVLKSGAVSYRCAMRGDDSVVRCLNTDRFGLMTVTETQIRNAERRVREKVEKMEAKRTEILQAEYKRREEEKFRQQCRDSYESLRDKFNETEHIQIAFVPLVIAQVAWIFAEKTRRWCVDNSMQETKVLSRAVRKVRDDYEHFLMRDLLPSQVHEVERVTDAFLNDSIVQTNFTIAYYTISNEFARQFVGTPTDILLSDCRTWAMMSKLMIYAYQRHNNRMNELFRERVGYCSSVDNPLITDKLMACIDAYIGDFILKPSEHLRNIGKIFDKSIRSYTFNIKIK